MSCAVVYRAHRAAVLDGGAVTRATARGRCHRCAPQWWGSVPAVVQRAVIQALFKHGGLRGCSGDTSICEFHMKLAFRQIVRKWVTKVHNRANERGVV